MLKRALISGQRIAHQIYHDESVPLAQKKSPKQVVTEVVQQYQVDVEISPGTNYEKKEGHNRIMTHQYRLIELFVGASNPFLIQHSYRTQVRSSGHQRYSRSFIATGNEAGAKPRECTPPSGVDVE